MHTHDVRIWDIRVLKGKTKTSYNVRWIISGREFSKTFATKALAEGRRIELSAAQRRGESFDTESGLPESEVRRQLAEITWYSHAIDFADMKWPSLEPGSRRSLADALATLTLALVDTQTGAPDYRIAFRALVGHAFNKPARETGDTPSYYATALEWVAKHSLPIASLADPKIARQAYTATTTSHTGEQFSANTYRNKMKGLSGAIRYAIELGHLNANPLDRITKSAPRKATTIDRRVVVNPVQARKLIEAVKEQGRGRTGAHLTAFFAILYYAGLRPSEALALRAQDCTLPKKGWGELCFAESSPYAHKAWTNDGGYSPRKALKHRPKDQSRTVPACPDLVKILRAHLAEYGTAEDGRLFAREDGEKIRPATYAKIWADARRDVLTKVQYDSPLGKRPYDLRHACVSTWLNAGVPAPQVAEWAGHSVEMLLSTYAKCVDGQEALARERIERALDWKDDEAP